MNRIKAAVGHDQDDILSSRVISQVCRDIRCAVDPHRIGVLIETVYQDLALAAEIDPAANMFLGREILRRSITRSTLSRSDSGTFSGW